MICDPRGTARRRSVQWLLPAVICLLTVSGRPIQAQQVGAQRVHFSDYSVLASNAEIARRMLSPLDAAQMKARLQQRQQALSPQAIDLKSEQYLLVLPAVQPAAGYGLLVFISPWDQVQLPVGWVAELSRRGIILVAADRSGNDQDILGRRIPLALLAAENVLQRFTVNPQRTYIGGFSGGARIALRIALAYPDVFVGALLNAGSDPIGTAQIAIPPQDLFERFQQSSRLLYTTGDRDEYHLTFDRQSQASMASWCVYGTRARPIRGGDHEMMDSRTLGDAFDALGSAFTIDQNKLLQCRAAIEQGATRGMDRVEQLYSSGDTAAAARALRILNDQFGGMIGTHGLAMTEKLSGLAAGGAASGSAQNGS